MANLDYEKLNGDTKSDFSFYSLYENADIVVKSVIYILICFFIVSWMIFIANLQSSKFYAKRFKKDIKL